MSDVCPEADGVHQGEPEGGEADQTGHALPSSFFKERNATNKQTSKKINKQTNNQPSKQMNKQTNYGVHQGEPWEVKSIRRVTLCHRFLTIIFQANQPTNKQTNEQTTNDRVHLITLCHCFLSDPGIPGVRMSVTE